MLKITVKQILVVLLLIGITFLSFNALSFDANATIITITSKGAATVEKKVNGSITWKCDNSDPTTCTISINLNTVDE